MAISSVIFGRTTNALQAERLISAVQRDQVDIARLQAQLSSGNRLQLPSDDPIAAIQIFALKDVLARQAIFQNNIQINQGYLSVTDQSLSTVADALNQAKAIAQQGIGSTLSDSDRKTLAVQAGALLQAVTNAGNAQYLGRYIFGGSYGTSAPFSSAGSGIVRYNGDSQSLQTYADFGFTVANNIDGLSAFAGLTPPIITSDLNPALSLATRITDLRGGAGVALGSIDVTVDDGSGPVTKTVDLTHADTLQDVKDRIENAFAGSGVSVTVAIDPVTKSGLKITPSVGTVAIQNTPGSQTATQLGIVSTAATSISGSDLDPRLSIFTAVADLNNGAGIGSTVGTGLKIVNGSRTSLVDLDGAVTVQDVLNRIRAADPDVVADISPDGRGIAVSSRLSGADFSIGENGGLNATNLGIRTFNSSTLLSQLNYGAGIALDQGAALTITRRDGTTSTVDLTGAATVQDVLDKINAVDPGHLRASLNAVGNGISLTDDSGSGTLTVNDNELARRLGIAGSDSGGAAGVLIGRDVNPQQPPGALSILATLQRALQTGDNQTLTRLLSAIDAEINRVNSVRGAVGSRQKLMDAVNNQLGDTQITNKDSLSKLSDADLAQVISELLQKQQTLQATLQMAAQVNQLSLLNYL
jgi:flagellar hook-associated protein 3 FlgL